MLKWFVLLALVVSCGKVDVENGKNGSNGEDGLKGNDGLNFYSYMVDVNIQEIIGDGRDELVELGESTTYQLPKTFQVTVDNPYPECAMQDFQLVIETDSEKLLFTFQPTENRYQMIYKDGPINKVVDSSTLKVYYKKEPEVDCGDVVYRLHSGVQFQIRVIKELEIE